jgi:predicted Zn-dependent protease
MLKKITIIICFILFLLVSKHVAAMTIQEEIKLGEIFSKQVCSHFSMIEDQDILSYVTYVGNRLLKAVPEKHFNFSFYVIREKTYNAFAGPGGHIFIHSGLIEAMTSELELAGIMAHEIAHVICRHISERIERSKPVNLAAMAGTIAGILVGGNVGAAMVVGSAAAQQSMFLAYTRENEREADQNSLRYLRDARYNGLGLLTILKKIKKHNWIDVSGIPTYVMSHPAINERLIYLDTTMNARPEFTRAPDQLRSFSFNKVRMRIQALYSNNYPTHSFENQLKKNPDDFLGLYGYGLRLAVSGKRKRAVKALTEALKIRPFDSDILRDTGIAHFYAGDYSQAFRYLKSANNIASNDYECQFFLGRTYENLGNSDLAVDLFERLLITNPKENRLYYHLGTLYGRIGKLDNAHYHLGIFYQKKNNMKLARFHIKKAMSLIDNSSNRYKEMEELLKTNSHKKDTIK